MTPEEFRLELEKLPVPIETQEYDIYTVHVEGETFYALYFGQGAMASILAQTYNVISKEPEKFAEEIERIKNLMSTRFLGSSTLCNRAPPKENAEELFLTELKWARTVWGAKIKAEQFFYYAFWKTRPQRYRFVLCLNPVVSGTDSKQHIRNEELDKKHYAKAVEEANRHFDSITTVAIFVGHSAEQYKVWKCKQMTRELWVLLLWFMLGSTPSTITDGAYCAYCCLFNPCSASEAWYGIYFPGPDCGFVQWEPVETDEIYEGVVFTQFLTLPC